MTAKQLRDWRRRLDLSQPAAASELGVPVSTYRNWEQGHRPLHPLLDAACKWVAYQRSREG